MLRPRSRMKRKARRGASLLPENGETPGLRTAFSHWYGRLKPCECTGWSESHSKEEHLRKTSSIPDAQGDAPLRLDEPMERFGQGIQVRFAIQGPEVRKGTIKRTGPEVAYNLVQVANRDLPGFDPTVQRRRPCLAIELP